MQISPRRPDTHRFLQGELEVDICARYTRPMAATTPSKLGLQTRPHVRGRAAKLSELLDDKGMRWFKEPWLRALDGLPRSVIRALLHHRPPIFL